MKKALSLITLLAVITMLFTGCGVLKQLLKTDDNVQSAIESVLTGISTELAKQGPEVAKKYISYCDMLLDVDQVEAEEVLNDFLEYLKQRVSDASYQKFTGIVSEHITPTGQVDLTELRKYIEILKAGLQDSIDKQA